MRSFRTIRSLLSLVCLLTIAAPSLVHAQTAAAPAGARFAADIQQFLDSDKTSPPPANGIEFIGSSIFRQWTTVAEDMAGLPVFNRAFGGSRTADVNAYIERVVLPYKPAMIVYYCGSNDVLDGASGEEIFANFREFEMRVHRALPHTRIFYFAINRAPDKRNRWDVVDEANRLAQEYAYRTANLDYVESNSVLFDAKDEPLTALYKADGLHFNPPAYVEFTKLIKPVLQRAMMDRKVPATNN